MDINEVFKQMIGKDEEGHAKSMVSIHHNLYTKNDENVISINEHSMDNPEVVIESSGELTRIKLKFSSFADGDLKIAWALIQKCNKDLISLPVDEENRIYFLSMHIIPKALNGRHFAVATNPLFCEIVTEQINERVDTISMIFNSDDVVFYEADEEDVAQIESEIEREFEEQDRQEMMAERKREERDAYREKRERLIQERRGFQ